MHTTARSQRVSGGAGATRRVIRPLGRAVVVLSLTAAVLTVGGLAVVNALGRQVMIVASGSMAPEFAAGDAVLIQEVTGRDLRSGLVIAFHAPGEPENLTTHRIVSRRPRAEGLFLQTQGDANPAPDPNFVHAGAVVGAMTHSVPHLGRWLAFYQTPTGRVVVLGLPLVLLCAAQARSSWRQLRPRNAPGAPHRDRQVLAASTVVVLASMGAGVVLALTTSAAFADTQSTNANTFSTSGAYCGTGTTYQQAVVANTPLVYHRFSETTGTAAANTGSGSAGTYTGGFTLAQPGAIACESGTAANAVRLNGTTGQVVNNNATAAAVDNTFSLEAWFKTSTGGGKLVGFGSSRTALSANYDRHLYLTDAGKLVFGVRPGGTTKEVVSPATYLDGQWHHVVATLGTTGMRLYVDGVEVVFRTDVTTGQSGYTGYWRIGWDNLANTGSPPTSYYYNGFLDEVAVFTNTLSAAQVTAHWTERRN